MKPLLEAEYADGYIHSEKQLNDASPYIPGKNVFHDIYEGHPIAEHGPLVRLTLFYKEHKYTIDWTKVPTNARPIRYMNMRRDRVMQKMPDSDEMFEVSDVLFIEEVGFGYQYTDADGHSQKVIKRMA